MIDSKVLRGWRVPGTKVRRVALEEALALARREGMVEPARAMEAMACELGVAGAGVLPAILLISPDRTIAEACIGTFDASQAHDLIQAGALSGARSYRAVLVDCVLGSDGAAATLRHFGRRAFRGLILGVLANEDCADAEYWLRHGAHLVWRHPCNPQDVIEDLEKQLSQTNVATYTPSVPHSLALAKRRSASKG